MGTRLTDNYPNTYSDFYGSGTPCIFKSGPDWHARPVYRHAIGPTWLSIGKRIYHGLDSIGVKWTSINPLAYADAGEAKPSPSNILAEAGFPAIEVAFVESVVTRSVAAGSKLLSFDPLFNDFPDLRKPFTATLGLSIAPLKYPHFEGTAALYFRLDKDNKRTAMLTCAHVARPPPVYANTGMTRRNTSQVREEIVALGNGGYNNAVKAMMSTIGDLFLCIDAWNDALGRLGEPVEGENIEVTESREEHVELVVKATRRIEKVNAIHDERVIGFVLHSEKIEVSVEPYSFTKDWALIELYDEKIDWPPFKGNKVYVGGNLSIADFGNTMFPQRAYGVVQDDEIRDPQHLDAHGEKCLLVVKNGSTTRTTVGRTNGLESFTRIYDDHGIEHTSIEIAVLPYKTRRKFSGAGDSETIVLARDGRILGILTGSAGPIDETDITYFIPYWWIEQQTKAKYPDCFLYDVGQ
ncbi:hypothetical protein H4582DRAFT_2111739 [Lactarius indigo]|nr:hypothetical protein H4582DRAFT_2111739 [Lactarius indigo]